MKRPTRRVRPRRRGVATAARKRAVPPARKRAVPSARNRVAPSAAAAAPTLAELQRQVDAWIGQFEEGYWPPLSMLARLTEEVGELARELNHAYGHKPKKSDEPPGDIALEVADIIFVLVCLCNSLGIDLGEAFRQVMRKYDARDLSRWTRKARS